MTAVATTPTRINDLFAGNPAGQQAKPESCHGGAMSPGRLLRPAMSGIKLSAWIPSHRWCDGSSVDSTCGTVGTPPKTTTASGSWSVATARRRARVVRTGPAVAPSESARGGRYLSALFVATADASGGLHWSSCGRSTNRAYHSPSARCAWGSTRSTAADAGSVVELGDGVQAAHAGRADPQDQVAAVAGRGTRELWSSRGSPSGGEAPGFDDGGVIAR